MHTRPWTADAENCDATALKQAISAKTKKQKKQKKMSRRTGVS